MDYQRSSTRRSSDGRRALLLATMMLSLLVGTLASYQPSLAAQRGTESQPRGNARPAAGNVTMSQSANSGQVEPGGTINYTVSIHNGFTDTISISDFADAFNDAGASFVSINSGTNPGWISCSDPGGGSTLSCSNGTIAAGGDQAISFSVVVHSDAPNGTALNNQANIAFRLPSDTDDRAAFSNTTSVSVAGSTPPTNTAVPVPTDTPSLGQPTLPPPPTEVPANTPVPEPRSRTNRDDEGDRGRGGGAQPTTPPAQVGLIYGIVVRGNNAAANVPVTVHLKQGDADTQVGTATTDANGRYTFSGLPATAAGAGYYVYFASSAAGDIAQWFTYQVSFSGSEVKQLPTFDIADLTLANQSRDVVSGNVNFTINRRYASETYLLRFAPWNRPNSTTLDVGSLGNANSFTLNSALLPANRYQGLIKIVDTTAGYGFPNTHFAFSVGGTGPAPTVVVPQPTAGTGAIVLTLSANTGRTVPGSTVIYSLSARNSSSANLSNVRVTVPLVAGQTVDIFNTKTSLGSLQVSTDNQVVVTIPVLAPNQTINISIYVAVGSSTGSVLSIQAVATADQLRTATKSNTVSVSVVGGDTGRPAPAPGGGTGGTGGTGLPNTGGEFTIWLLLLAVALGGLAIGLRRLRNHPSEKAIVGDE